MSPPSHETRQACALYESTALPRERPFRPLACSSRSKLTTKGRSYERLYRFVAECNDRGVSPISRGFRGRGRRDDVDPSRIPPGQYVTGDFPVLSAGPTPHTRLEDWTFSIRGAVDEPVAWSWEEFQALPSETVTRDIH